MYKIYVAALFFSVPAVFGWNLAINNQTPYEAHVRVFYPACNYDHRIIPSGAIAHVDAKGCAVRHVIGVLVIDPGDTSKNIAIRNIFSDSRLRDFSIAIGKYDWEPDYYFKYTFFNK